MVLRNSALKKLVRKPGYQEVTLGELLHVNFQEVPGMHFREGMPCRRMLTGLRSVPVTTA